MIRYYIDTCIWIDYFEDRKDKFRPLGDWALSLIKKIIENGDYFVISDHLITELSKNYFYNEFFKIIPNKLIIEVEFNENQTKEAFKLKKKLKIPFKDILHAIIARDSDSIMVTRDKHFYKLSKEVVVKKPEELI
jgi:predicted nucleic acid-binding protein